MSDFEATPIYELDAQIDDEEIRDRLASATPLELLSDRGESSKLLQLVVEPDGQQFVRRDFTELGVAHVEHSGLPFDYAWRGMHTVFSEIGTPVVPSVLVEGVGHYPYVAASKWLTERTPVSDAPTETKKLIAHNLGQMLHARHGYRAAAEMFSAGNFVLDESGDKPTITLVDVDPAVIPRPPRYLKDGTDAYCIDNIGRLLNNSWTTDNDRREVMTAFLRSLGDFVPDDIDDSSETFTAFSNIHHMVQLAASRR